MTILCNVSGPLVDPSGDVLPSTKVIIKANAVRGQYGKLKLPKDKVATSDASGILTVSLLPGLYTGHVTASGRTWTFPLLVPEEAEAVLGSQTSQEAPPITATEVLEAREARYAAVAAQAATAVDRAATDEDAAATAADRIATGIDATATAADRVQTGLGRIATGQDRVQTGLDVAASLVARTGAETVTTAAGVAQAAAEAARTWPTLMLWPRRLTACRPAWTAAPPRRRISRRRQRPAFIRPWPSR
jgi:hypothetical protein